MYKTNTYFVSQPKPIQSSTSTEATMMKRKAYNNICIKLLGAFSNSSNQENELVPTRCILDGLSHVDRPLNLPPPPPGLVSLNLLAYPGDLVTLAKPFAKKTENDLNFLVVNTDSNFLNVNEEVNEWVKDTSNGKITTITNSEELRSNKIMLKTKSIFRGNWESSFDVDESLRQFFFYATSEVEAMVPEFASKAWVMDMMTCTEVKSIPIFQTKDTTAVVFEYGDMNKKESFFAFMPHEVHSKKQLLEKLANLNFEELLEKMAVEDAITVMPKFKYTCKYDINRIIDEQIDEFSYNFFRVFQNGRQRVGFSHTAECSIDNNEIGTMPTAIKANLWANDFGYFSYKTCVLDKPFIFFILDKQQYIITAGLFMDARSL